MTRIRGEYWITDDGDVWFADGDVGDMNHESYALDHARRRLCDLLGNDIDEDFATDVTFWKKIDEVIGETFEPAAEDMTWRDQARSERKPVELWAQDFLRKKLEEESSNVSEDLACFDKYWAPAIDAVDVKEHAVAEWGWIWVRGNNCAVAVFDEATRAALDRGISEIADQEGIEGEEFDDLEITVSVQSNREHVALKAFEIKTAPLTERISDLENDAASRVATEQVRKMDEAAQHPFYRGRHM